MRVLRDKVGLQPRYLEQLATLGGAARDPRGWSISVAYYVLLHASELAGAAPGLVWHPADALPALPFDHAAIVAAAFGRLRGKSAYSSLPASLLPASFTIRELHHVYEQVMGIRLDPASFRRKIGEQRIIEPAGKRRKGAHRPARLSPARSVDRTRVRSADLTAVGQGRGAAPDPAQGSP